MINFYVYFAVIVCGASVLAIELLGTRIIAPFYGVSLYLWSALISVTLAALSVGYAVGGRLADRGPKLSRFASVIGLAGLWIVLIPWLRTPILALSEAAGLRMAVLLSATVLFFPPLALLGIVSPYAIRLKASSLSVVGQTAGNLYAVSTIASVVAAVMTGFFLIPSVGVHRLIVLIGFALIGTSVAGIIVNRRSKAVPVAPLVILVAVAVGYVVAPAQTPDPERGLIAVEQSAYAEIRIVDYDGLRYMLIDGSMHSGADPDTWRTAFRYVNVLDIPRLFFDRPGKMLLVGLGGGSVVKSYVRSGWKVDAVEIDPVVTRIAREYFGLDDTEAEVFTMDGRKFLMTGDRRYDVIVMDAFGSSSIPFHLVTKEAFGLVRSRLAPDGILAMNIHSIGWHDNIVATFAATIGQQFKHVLVLPIAEPPDQLGNIILLASDRELELAPENEPPVPSSRFNAEYDRAHAWDNRFEIDTAGVQILTDDLNPIDVWSERINLESRRALHENLDEGGIVW
jgi:spermidine synthase